MTNEELQRAVERLRHRVDLESDNPYVVSAWSADDVLTRIVPHDDLVEMADAFRLLLSERAELLAAVERMREELDVAAVHLQIAGGWLREAGDDGQRANELLRASNRARAALTTGEEK